MSQPVPFDFDALRGWSKQEILDWIWDGEYCEFIMDPPMDQPAIERKRKFVMRRPRTREDRKSKLANLIPITEFHAKAEIGAAYRRLKNKGNRDPRNKTVLLREMICYTTPDWLNIYTDALDKWL